MKYTGSLVKKEREKIFELFLNNDKLKFSDIEKAIKIRSNMVSYHIEQMQKEDLIQKKGEYYQLTEGAERYIPIFSHVTGKDMSPLPVILVAAMDEKKGKTTRKSDRKNDSEESRKILLIKRNKRPYKDYWSMIGGKVLHDESFEEASQRIIKYKTGLDARFVSINSIFHEKVLGDDGIKHTFILIFSKADIINPDQMSPSRQSVHGELRWYDLKDIEKIDMIPSDRWLVKNRLDETIRIDSGVMKEKDGRLMDFKFD